MGEELPCSPAPHVDAELPGFSEPHVDETHTCSPDAPVDGDQPCSSAPPVNEELYRPLLPDEDETHPCSLDPPVAMNEDQPCSSAPPVDEEPGRPLLPDVEEDRSRAHHTSPPQEDLLSRLAAPPSRCPTRTRRPPHSATPTMSGQMLIMISTLAMTALSFLVLLLGEHLGLDGYPTFLSMLKGCSLIFVSRPRPLPSWTRFRLLIYDTSWTRFRLLCDSSQEIMKQFPSGQPPRQSFYFRQSFQEVTSLKVIFH